MELRRPRFVKIDKRESPKSTVTDDEDASDANLLHEKSKEHSKCKLTQMHSTENEKTTPGWRLQKINKFPRRISATHNIVYEFNPFGSSNSHAVRKGLQNVPSVGQGDSLLKPTNVKYNVNNARTKTSYTLPKLQSRSDLVLENQEKMYDMIDCSKRNNLPLIKKQEMDKGLMKDRKDRRKRTPTSEVDYEVEKVKSDWRTLRSSLGWTQTKYCANTRQRKLYDTLEKMAREIDKMQNSYLDSESSQYLKRGAMKALNAFQTSLEGRTNEIKNVLFPKESPKQTTAETLTTMLNNSSQESFPRDLSMKDMHGNKKLGKRSTISSKQSKDLKDVVKSTGNLPLNLKRNRRNSDVSFNAERYFEKYIANTEKKFATDQDSTSSELNTTSDNVMEMFKKLNMESFDMYDIGDNSDDQDENFLRQNMPKIKNTVVDDLTKKTMDVKIGSMKEFEIPETNKSSEINQLMRNNSMLSSETSVQTNVKPTSKDNAFIQMGIHGLNANLPRDLLSRVLQSEYLKKDTSLKPM